MKFSIILPGLVVFLTWACVTCSLPGNAGSVGIFPFQNISLPWEERVNDLVSRLTLEELQLQMAKGGGGNFSGPAPAIVRLGVDMYQWDTECLHGDAGAPGNATSFPQSIGLAATFSPDLLYRVATAIGQEVRGKHNDFVKQGIFDRRTGASCFSPVINIARDPRWGRVQETYGEDPLLNGILSQNFVKGIKGNHARYIQANACCKHFDVYGGPENIPSPRASFNAIVSESDWRMTFLPAFKKCVEAGVFSIMCSYNSINGVPACANRQLLTDILRTEFNFTGYVVSDESALERIITEHHYLNNSVDAAAVTVNAGVNLELPPNKNDTVFMHIVEAVNQGKLSEDLVRERVKPLFYTRMRLGEFDPPELNPYSKLDSSVVESPEHRALAVEAAVKSFVLLKNQNNVLPLKPEMYKNVAIIGPMANNVGELFGDYSAQQDRSFTKTPLQGLQELYSNIKYGKGCQDGTPCTIYNVSEVNNTVSGTDLVFLTLGTGIVVETEGRDRPDIFLPGLQLELALDTIFYSNNATIIVLLFSAGPLNITLLDSSPRVKAILECFFPGQATGAALVNVLTNRDGKSSPAGRLPITWPMYYFQIPPMVNYSMEGRTYRYFNGPPLYPFGYGLSYSSFEYYYLALEFTPVDPFIGMNATLFLSNTGDIDADEVIQCYIEWENKSLPVPNRQLAYFDRVHIQAGQEIRHDFNITWESWAFWDNGTWDAFPGEIYVSCGGQQPDQTKAALSNVLVAEAWFIRDTPSKTRGPLVSKTTFPKKMKNKIHGHEGSQKNSEKMMMN